MKTVYKLTCERKTGERIKSALDFQTREAVQLLADSLNKRFRERRYFVEEIRQPEKQRILEMVK